MPRTGALRWRAGGTGLCSDDARVARFGRHLLERSKQLLHDRPPGKEVRAVLCGFAESRGGVGIGQEPNGVEQRRRHPSD